MADRDDHETASVPLALACQRSLAEGRDDPEGWAALWDAVRPVAVGVARSSCRLWKAEVVDAVQECYPILLRCVPGYDPGRAPFPAYFRAALRRDLGRALRRRDPEPMPDDAAEWLVDPRPGPLARASRRERRRLLLLSLRRLDPDERRVLRHRYPLGRRAGGRRATRRELTRDLGLAPYWVGRHEAEGLAKLRALLAALDHST